MTTFFSPTQFIEDALFCTTPLSLSYADPNQKWTIRQHLISLFQNCSYLKPSLGIFTHNDGTQVKLLAAVGALPVSPPVPLTIWVHELYPQVAPIVYVNLENSDTSYPIYSNHPFVDPSGATTSSYLANWACHRSNLTDLVHSLIKLFNHNHPFYYDHRRCSHPSSLSKTEAMDRLTSTIYYDLHAAMAENEEEIQRLATIQVKLQERADQAEVVINGLDLERRRLKGRIKEICEETDKVSKWLKAYENKGCVLDIDEVCEGSDGRSKAILEWSAADGAADDLMYALDKAVESGVLGFGEYMKRVRELAREQFLWRAKVARIRGGFVLG